MIKESLQEQLHKAQTRLREGNIGVAIVKRGKRLYLRATLPPKPGSGNDKWHQQYISLGTYANTVGIQQAEAQAKKIGKLVALGQFNWEPYMKKTC